MADTPELLLASRRCSQCLTTRNRIVPGERAAQIVRSCHDGRNHFFCHKGGDQKVHCRGVHDIVGGSRAHDFAQAFDIPIREVDPDALDPNGWASSGGMTPGRPSLPERRRGQALTRTVRLTGPYP